MTEISNKNNSDRQIDHAAKWCVRFVETFKKELSTVGVPYAMIHEEYSKTTNVPIGSKKFAPMLHLCGLERVVKDNVVTYFLITTRLD